MHPLFSLLTFSLFIPGLLSASSPSILHLEYSEYAPLSHRASFFFTEQLASATLDINATINASILVDGVVSSSVGRAVDARIALNLKTLEIRFEWYENVQNARISVRIAQGLIKGENGELMQEEVLEVGQVYERVEEPFEEMDGFKKVSTAMDLLLPVLFLLFFLGYNVEMFDILAAIQMYRYLIYINSHIPEIYNYFLLQLDVMRLLDNFNIFKVGEEKIRCQNLRRFQMYDHSCAFLVDIGGIVVVISLMLIIKLLLKLLFLVSKILRSRENKKKFDMRKHTRRFRRLKSIAFQRSLSMAYKAEKSETKENYKNVMLLLKKLDEYMGEQFWFYALRAVTIPLLVPLWINMFRFRNQTFYMEINFLLSIFLSWIFVGYSMWTIYLYMNYHGKSKEDNISWAESILISKKKTFKRREIIVAFIIDEFKSSVYVFFLDISIIVYPLFLILNTIIIASVCTENRTPWTRKIVVISSNLCSGAVLMILFYYKLADIKDDSFGVLLITLSICHIGLMILKGIVLLGVGLLMHLASLCQSSSKVTDANNHNLKASQNKDENERETGGVIVNKIEMLSVQDPSADLDNFVPDLEDN